MKLDRGLPMELHAQITQEMRYRIAAGTLAPGTRLPSAREGAALWGVNFHTVRRAYQELARLGLVEINGAAGTRVADASVRLGDSEGLGSFVEEFLARSSEDYGLSVDELIVMLRNHGHASAGSVVSVVECNTEQARELADQISSAFEVEASARLLSDAGTPPGGVIVGTLFHRVEMLDRWPDRRASMRFLPIRPDASLVEAVRGTIKSGTRRVPLFARDAGVAAAMSADVQRLFESDDPLIEPRLLTPTGKVPRAALSGTVLVSPVDWAGLPGGQADHPRVMRVPYSFDRFRLGAIAHSLGWRPRSDAGHSLSVCPYSPEVGT